ncbi:hypothetical protein BJ944DRAFT_259191 [Cunninghamella echinulata]|nr:hypothetical protein BJ944DRAFT_259191 [Cunninghamella echinulata]
MTFTQLDEKFDGTFRQLFDIIEQSVDISASTDLLQTLLEEQIDQLALGLDVFGEPSVAARNKITPDKSFIVNKQSITITSAEKASILQLAQQLNLNELNVALIYAAYQLNSISNQNSLFSAFTSAYFQERLSLLASLSNLLSLCNTVTINEEKVNNTVTSIAQSTMDSLLKKKSDFLEKLLDQYTRLVRHAIPPSFSKSIHLNRSYAVQNLKEQKKLLEIMVLLVLKEPCDGELTFKFYQEFEANGFGTRFAFDYTLDTIEGEKLRTQVTQLCIVLAIRLLQVPSLTGSNITSSSLEKINQIMLFLGDQQVHSLPLLAWARYIRSTLVLPTTFDDNVIINGTQQINTSLLSNNCVKSIGYVDAAHRQPCIEQGPNMDQRFTGRALRLECFEFLNTMLINTDLNNDGYTYIYYQTIFDLLQGFTSTINHVFLPNDVYKSLLSCYNILLQHEPLLCKSFWDTHFADTTSSLLTTVQNRFPYNFLDLVQLLCSLACTSDDNNRNYSAQQVFEYATLTSTLTVSLKSSDISKTTLVNEILLKAVGYINLFGASTYNDLMISELVIQPGTKGAIVLRDNQHQVVNWQYSYSILHYLAHLLILVVQQKKSRVKNNSEDFEFITSDTHTIQTILQLFEKLLNSTSKSTLINHIEALKVGQSTHSGEIHAPLLISVLCDILSTTTTTNTALLASALRCLTALVPQYSSSIWPFILTSNIFPNQTPVYFGMEENSIPLTTIIRKVERIAEKYQLLLSLLDFIKSLLESLKYDDENGDERIRSIYAFLKYILEDILPSYLDWSYKNVYEKYLIGTKIMAIFIHIERHFTNQDSIINLRQDVLNKFSNDHGDYVITSLLDTMAYNASRLNKLHADGFNKIAKQAEQLTKLTFIFIKSLLLNQQLIKQQEQHQQQQQLNNQKTQYIEGSVLERRLLEHVSSHSHKTDFLLALAQWINYKHDPDLPILATNIISALCVSVSKWKMVPNFVQYLGDKSQAQEIIKNYLEIAKDVKQSERLLSAIWQMITTLLESQPSLALLFMECGDTIMPSPKTAVKLLDHSNANIAQTGQQLRKSPKLSSSSATTTSIMANIGSNQSGESALRAAVDLLNDWQSLSINKPSVLSNVLKFLATFWQTAFDHYALVQRTRSDNVLWQNIEAILFNQPNTNSIDDEIAPNFDFLFKNGNYNLTTLIKKFENQHSNSVHLLRQQCCMRISRAYLMRLISFEIQLTFGSLNLEKGDKDNIGDKLPTGLKTIVTKLSDKLTWMQTNIVKNDYNPKLGKELHKLAEQLNLPLCKMKPIGWGDDINNTDGRQYGPSYVYDLQSSIIHIIDAFKLVEHKYGLREEDDIDNLVVTSQVQAVKQQRERCSQFLTKLYSTNFNYSLADSDMVLLQAFKTMLEASSSHVGHLLWKSSSTSQKLTLYSFLRGLMEHLLKITANSEQQNGVIWKSYQETAILLRALIEDYINNVNDSNNFTNNLLALIPSTCLLLERGQHLATSFNDSKGQIIIDRACFESILLCLRLLPSDAKFDSINDTEMKANLMNSLSTLLNASCKKLLKISHTLATKSSKQLQTKKENDGDDEEDEFVKYVTVILALLGELVQCEFIDINIWLSTFERNDTIPLLLQLISHGIRFLVDEMDSQTQIENNKLHNIIISPYAENAFYFLISLSNIPQAALILQQHDVMHLLCNNRLSKQLQQGTLDIFVRFQNGTLDSFVERNPLHIIWCQMLQVVSNMIRSTGTLNDNKVDDILRKSALFIQKYGNQVDRSFSIANGKNDRRQHGLAPSESLSTALLLELELLTNIFFGLSKYLNNMKSYASSIFIAFKNTGLPLIQRYHYFLTHPTHMQAQLFPINQEELRQSTITENGSGDGDEKSSVLMHHVTEKTLLIIGNIIGTMVVLTDAQTVLLEEDMLKWPFGNTILQPQSTTSSCEGISFGVITEFIETSLHLLSIRCSNSQADIDIILNSVEQSTILLTTQIVLWIAKPGLDQEQRNIIANNHLKSLINLLDKIKTSLKKWEDEKQGNIKLMMVLRTQVIDPLIFYIINRYFQSNH